MQKFINITTRHTENEIAAIVKELNDYEIERLETTYAAMEYIEYVTEQQKVAMYAILDNATLKVLCNQLLDLGLTFEVNDYTEIILFNIVTELPTVFIPAEIDEHTKNQILELQDMFDNFRIENLTTDVILEKLLKHGSNALTDQDKRILKNH